jgi:hypothetical protein
MLITTHQDLDLVLPILPLEDDKDFMYSCAEIFLDCGDTVDLASYKGKYPDKLRRLLEVVSKVLGGSLVTRNTIKRKMVQKESYQRLLNICEKNFHGEAPFARALEDIPDITAAKVDDLVEKWRKRADYALKRIGSSSVDTSMTPIGRVRAIYDWMVGNVLNTFGFASTNAVVDLSYYNENIFFFRTTLATVKSFFQDDNMCNEFLQKIQRMKEDDQRVYPFMIVIAPSGTGKTTFCLNMCCRNDVPAIYALFSALWTLPDHALFWGVRVAENFN